MKRLSCLMLFIHVACAAAPAPDEGSKQVAEKVSDPAPFEEFDESFTGRVIDVENGEALTLQTSDNGRLKIRLSEIDAPQLTQPYGLRAREYLMKICAKKEAYVNAKSKEKKGRIVGRVHCHATSDAEPVDASVEQVRRGVAWAYRGEGADDELIALETEARKKRRGLWTDPNPIQPREWRGKGFK